MASLPQILLTFVPSFLFCTINPVLAEDADFVKFRVFWHDVVSGSSPTAVRVAQAKSSNSSSTFFGGVVVIDDPLTVGPKLNSEPVGRAQGTYIFADKDVYGLHMSMNFVFTGGEYNGSSIAILGRNEVLRPVREMPVIGGTGKFRMARGYVEARTYTFLSTAGETVVEYRIFVKP